MRPKQMSVCFSGYRPEKLPWGENEADPRCEDLKKRLYEAVCSACEEGYAHFICGMARGADLYACEAALAAGSGIPISRWSRPSRALPRPTAGRRGSGRGGGHWWRGATLKRWCRPGMRRGVCSGATGTWWSTADASLPYLTDRTAVRSAPWNMPCGRAWRWCFCRRQRDETGRIFQ